MESVMKLPGKDSLKKAFLVAAAGVGIVGMSGCAVAVRPVGVGVYIPPPPVVVEPYPYYGPAYVAPPVIVVPARPYYHHRGWR
jgi:hypothetical protein